MKYIYFYAYLAAIVLLLFICSRFRAVTFNHFIIGIATVAYSLTYETILGEWLGLYYYIDRTNSVFYMVLGGLFIYPALNMLYIIYMPKDPKYFLLYTGAWIAALLLFEYVTVLQGIIVMTGWKPLPWSVATYALTYIWINVLYKHLNAMKLTSSMK